MAGSLLDSRLVSALRDPSSVAALGPGDWSALVAAARAGNLAGLLGVRVHDAGVSPVPGAARALEAARQLSERQIRSVTWEVHCLRRALAGVDCPVVLLKGAAYVMSGHPVSRGRLFGDIDILVPRQALGSVEVALMRAGWTSGKHSAYDQRYYRTWMHELPPMLHVRRGTVLDVHHTILPLTSRSNPDATRIIRRASPLAELPGIRVPSPEDLVIHSITHLMHEGELHNGLRDLFDIDGLLRDFGRREGFWSSLLEYAREHGLAAPVGLGLHLAHCFIDTPVPAAVREATRRAAGSGVAVRLLEAGYRRAMSTEEDLLTQFARAMIYLRAHWLRMPPLLLVRHLGHKALMHFARDQAAPAGRA